jgi:hypothetical protein
VKFKDVIVWNAAAFSPGDMEAASKLAAKSGKLVIVVGPGESIETLGKDEMRRAGWVPLADLAALREAAQAVVEADVLTDGSMTEAILNRAKAMDRLRAVLASADSEEATDA